MVETLVRFYTPEEYLALELEAETRSEYRDGEIVPMTGGTTNHNGLALNLATTLKLSLRGQDCRVYIADVRLWIPEHRQYTYPDVMVIPGQPIYADSSKTTVMNPQILAEVLSKSTRNYDQGEKFMYYRSIPQLQEYLLVDQAQHHVIQHTKTETGQWLLTEYRGLSAALTFQAIDLTLPLTDLYDGIDL